MSNVGSVIVAWGAMAVLLGTYALWVLSRGRKLAEQVPVDRQRWMTTEAAQSENSGRS